MIPRYQRILFWILIAAILLMALVLLRGCEQAREKLTRQRDLTPLAAPVTAPDQPVRLAVADDATGSITMVNSSLALPTEMTARVRTLLTALIAQYSYKGSTHPLESGPAVDDVFLLDLPLHPAVALGGKPPRAEKPTGSSSNAGADSGTHAPDGQLAVINLDESFADHHPSGIEPETLTINSIIGTLYANFPEIEEVRFLVDGQPRQTLNGHANLMHIYPVIDTASDAQQPDTDQMPTPQPAAQGNHQ